MGVRADGKQIAWLARVAELHTYTPPQPAPSLPTTHLGSHLQPLVFSTATASLRLRIKQSLKEKTFYRPTTIPNSPPPTPPHTLTHPHLQPLVYSTTMG